MASSSSGLPVTGVEMVAANLQGFLNSLQTGNNAVAQFGKGMDSAGKQTGSASQIMIGALRQVGSLATDYLLKAGRALIGFGQDSLRLAGDFTDGMYQFQVAAGKDLDTKGLEQFHDLFLQLGKDLPVSTSDVQQAAIEMVKGGIDPAILAAGGLKQNIQFASAAMKGDLVGAAEISAKVIAGWASVGATAAEKSELLAHATDLMTKAANASSVDVRELSLGLFNVQATAKNAGIGLDDVTTVLGELAGDFASSSEAGNSMASFINRLQPTTKSATAAMESLGLVTKEGGNVFYDAEGKFVGFRKTSEILKTALQGLTDQQRTSIMQTIFQKDAMGVAAGLAARGAEGYDAMTASLTNAMGVQAAGTTVQQGYNTAIENAKGGLEALQITLAENFLPYLTEMYNFLNNYVLSSLIQVTDAVFGNDEAFNTLSPTLQGVVLTINALVEDAQKIGGAFMDAGIGSTAFAESIGEMATDLGLPGEAITTIVEGLQDLSYAAGQVFDYFSEHTEVVEGLVVALGGLVIISTVAGWITGAIATISALGATMTAAGGGIAGVVAILGGPLTVAIAAVSAAIGLLYVAWTNNWGDIQGKTAAVWEYLSPIFDEGVNWLQVMIPKAIATASSYWTETLWPAMERVGAFIESTMMPVIRTLITLGLMELGAEVQVLGALWENVLAPALRVVGFVITDILYPIFKALFEVQFAIAQKVVTALAGLWQKTLQPAFEAAGNYINSTLMPAFSSTGGYISDTLGPILKDFTEWLSDITGGFKGVSNAVSVVSGYISSLADKISKLELPSWLTPGSPTPWEIALYGIGTALSESVSPGLSTMQGKLDEIGNHIQEAFQDGGIIEGFTTLAEDAMAGFGEGLESGLEGVERVINSTADTVEDAFKDAFASHSPSQRMVPVGEWISQGIMQGIMLGWGPLSTQIQALGDELFDQVTKISENVQQIMAEGMADMWGSTASIDRQKLANLKAMDEIDEKRRAGVQSQIDEAERIAMAMADPKQGAAFFKDRSKQLIELAQLNDQIQAETDAKKRERLQTEYDLINAAQQAEMKQFEAESQAKKGPIDDLIKQINDLIAKISYVPLDDAGIKLVDSLGTWISQLIGLQHRASGGPVDPDHSFWVGENGPEIFRPKVAGDIFPRADMPASFSQIMSSVNNQTSNINNSNHVEYNMPIYTNNTPAAIQHSIAIAQSMAL